MSTLGWPRSNAGDGIHAGTLRELGLPMLMVSLVLFVSAMTLLGANISELRQGYARVQQSNQALLELSGVSNYILKVEMAVRGYALSGDPIFLTWKKLGARGMRSHIAVFDTMFGSDPDQRANLNELKQLLDEHSAYFELLVQRVPKDREHVIGEIVAYSKRVGRHKIEDLLGVMRAHEMKELAQQQVLAETRVVSAYRYAIGMSAVALLLAGLGFALLVQDRRFWARKDYVARGS